MLMIEPETAVFGDIHSNLEALEAVFADMDAIGIRDRVCLGDIVGYAANPSQCLELVQSTGCQVLKGNHDAWVADNSALDELRDVARSGIEFSRGKLTPEQRGYLAALPLVISDDKRQNVHASLDAPSEWPYVAEERDARDHFRSQARPICFCGHTHVPRVWHQDADGDIRSWRGEGRIELPSGGKSLINAGSVGQPRDLCPDACYVVFDAGWRWVEFRRVPYDVGKTKRKIMRAKLPRFTAQRLSLGR